MATLYRQPGTRNWWIRYSKDGKQVRKSTGTEDKDEALLQLRETELLLGQHKSVGTVSQKLVRAIQQGSVSPMPLPALLEAQRKHVAARTRRLYEARDRYFLHWLRQNHPGVTLASEVDRPMLKAFLDQIAEDLSPRTHNGYRRRLRSVFRSALKDGFAIEDPSEGIALLPEEGSCRRAFTESELRKLFETVTGQTRILATLGLYAGAMRLSDIVALTWANVDLNRGVIRWRMSKRRGKPMEIAVHPRLKEELERSESQVSSDLVLPVFHNKVHRASEAFRQALVKAGMKKDNRPAINRRHAQRKKEREIAEQEGKAYVPSVVRRRKDELDFHSLRYNFVSILKTQGCPEAIARSIMGHASIEVSQIYTQIDAESERKWVTSLPDVVGCK